MKFQQLAGQRPSLRVVSILLGLLLAIPAVLPVAPTVHAAESIVVSTTLDSLSTDGFCSLREAIIAANKNVASSSKDGECVAGSGADTIIVPTGDYVLTRTDSGKEDSGATGDLDITESVVISASGPVTVTGGAGFSDRIFHILAGSVVISGVTLRGGAAATDGGAILNRGTLTLSQSTLTQNRAGARGGGLANQGTAYLTNVTISGNTAKDSGGGVANLSGSLEINNGTVASNIADADHDGRGDGGGAARIKGTLAFRNTVIADNTDASPSSGAPDCSGALTSQGYNLIESIAGCAIGGSTTGDITGFDPKLGALGDNGGTTATHDLLPGSPALNAGNPALPGSGGAACSAIDQRGEPRPGGPRCDVGALERQDSAQTGPVFSVIATVGVNDDLDDGVCSYFHCSLREAIAAANTRPNDGRPDQIVFALLNPAGGQPVITLTSPLPALTDPVVIDGTTQPGGALVLNGAGAGPGATCMVVTGGGSTLRGLTITECGGHGILLDGAGGNLIETNRIFANGGDGVRVASGNADTLRSNSIYDNAGLAIDLGGDGVTPADPGDLDSGPNDLINAPHLFRAVPDADSVKLAGRFNGAGNAAFTVQFFSVAACDASGAGEAQTPLSEAAIATDSTGDVYFFPILTGASAEGFVTATATDASGNTSELSNCVRIGPANETWTSALNLNLAGEPLSSTYGQQLDRQGQSRWYKFQVEPESKLVVTLTELPANYDLTVYRDIAAAFNQAATTDDLELLGAEFAPDAFSPDAFSPDAFSPDAFSPDAFSPDAFSPDAFSPDAFSPDAFSPDAFSPDAFSPDAFSPDAYSPDAFSPDAFSPDAFSPDAFSPDAFSPDAFSSAQQRSLIAVSAFEGTAGEGVQLNTHLNSGDYYVRVRGRNGAFDPNAQFQLDVQLLAGVCRDVSTIAVPTSLDAESGGYRTIILTDLARMAGTPDEKAGLQEALALLAERPEVNGVLVDVGADARVAAANAQADQYTACPYAKNLVAQSVNDIVRAYQTLNPLEYVVIVGNDDVIPFFRRADQALLASEINYVPPVRDATQSQASLRQGYVLSQDEYGAPQTLGLKDDALPLQTLAVGRLVESATEATGVVEAYLETPDGVVPTPQGALVTGYDFLSDAAVAVKGQLEAGLAAPVDSLITPRELSPLDPAAWTAADLRTALLETAHPLVFLAGHFSANSALAADYSTRLRTTDLMVSPVDFTNALVFSAGCHSGYNIVNAHGVPNVTQEPDWAQAFASRGATLIAGTGYQYGDTDSLKYSEQLYLEFARQLRMGSGPVAVGKALVAAKQAYLAATPQLRGIDEKALLEATLFGLPMLSVNMPGERLLPESTPSIAAPVPYSANPGAALGLRFADVSLSPSLAERTVQLRDLQSDSFVTATYLEGAGGVASGPTEPVLPLEKYNVSAPGTVLRGVGFRGGAYSDLANILPLTEAATTEIRGVHSPFPVDVFYPVRFWTLNYFDALFDPTGGDTMLMVTPAQFKSIPTDSQFGILRRFDSLQMRLFYSANTEVHAGGSVPALASAPTIVAVQSVLTGTGVDFAVRSSGNPAAGVQEVWVTYTASEGPFAGVWQSLDLVQDGGEASMWRGSLDLQGTPPGAVRFMVQAVNGVGLVALDMKLGAYYVPGGATEPTEPTELALTTPGSSGVYGGQIEVSAVLTTDGAPLIGQPITFRLGPQSRLGVTDAAGRATANLSLLGLPGNYPARAAFAGTDLYVASSASSPYTINKRATVILLEPPSVVSDVNMDTGIFATLTDDTGRRLGEKTIFFVLTGPSGSYAVSEITDFAGRAFLGRVAVPVGDYAVTAYFSGQVSLPGDVILSLDDVRYEPSSASGSLTMLPPNNPPICSEAYPSVESFWSPNNKFHPVSIMGVSDPDGDDLTITVTGIRQDEPTGNSIDGEGVGGTIAELRAERDGNGDGRVYHVYFSAADGHGGVCTGEIRVGAISHDQGGDLDAIDGGALYDSTVRS